ncbi:hypothetical protein A3747_12825 [Sulfitobacter sp. HI0076]|nr:hypothetical protein A3720_04725 [Sulfitobacter sp. HI0021]KZX95399.1 hypothetical protein A3722_18485 [Sulfitobacter sp. HI0027]KZZ03159.1 hypothetical protein A3747_12825 [Sulfitobacter sp. HI0076]
MLELRLRPLAALGQYSRWFRGHLFQNQISQRQRDAVSGRCVRGEPDGYDEYYWKKDNQLAQKHE